LTPLRWYLASTACVLVPGGIGMVLFPWLVVVLLHETPERVGLAQMAGQLPGLLLILFGGVIGDRVDQRKIMLAMHVVASLPQIVLAIAIGAGRLSYELLIAFAIVGGVIAAIAQPARDAMLSRVAGPQIQRIVTVMIALQFTVQILGFVLGGFADRVGAIPLLLFQSMVIASGALAVLQIRVPPLARATRATPVLRDIRDGISLALRSPRIAPAVVLTGAIGFFFGPTFIVLLPLMLRDVYGGSSAGLASVFAANMIGTVCATLYLITRGGIHRQGRAMMCALVSGCVVLSLLAMGLPYWAFIGVIFIWGLGAGVTMSMGRAIVQESTPPTHQARVLSVYSLGMMGGMPLGSLMMGFAIDLLGARGAVWIPVFGVASAVLFVYLRTDFWHVVPLPARPTTAAEATSTVLESSPPSRRATDGTA
jgi:MFS family permease